MQKTYVVKIKVKDSAKWVFECSIFVIINVNNPMVWTSGSPHVGFLLYQTTILTLKDSFFHAVKSTAWGATGQVNLTLFYDVFLSTEVQSVHASPCFWTSESEVFYWWIILVVFWRVELSSFKASVFINSDSFSRFYDRHDDLL